MSRFSITFVALVACALFVSGSPAHAGFMWNGPDGMPGQGTVFKIKFNDYEVALKKWDGSASQHAGNTRYSAADILSREISGGQVTAEGQEIYGIIGISSINDAGGTKTYWSASPTQQIDGVFWNYIVKGTPSLADGASFTNGAINLYFNNSHNFSSATGPFSAGWGGAVPDTTTLNSGVKVSNGVGNATDDLLLAMLGVAGANLADTDVTLKASFALFGATDIEGSGQGYLSVTGNLGGIGFQKDGFDPTHSVIGNQDAKLINNFTTASDSGVIGAHQQDTNGWSLNSQDPLSGIATVPEPGSLGLMGLGVLALVGTRNRRRKLTA